MLVRGVVSALIVALAHPWIVPPEIADSWWLLAVYVFLFLNLEVLVSYWLAHGHSVRGHAVHAGGHGVAAGHPAGRGATISATSR